MGKGRERAIRGWKWNEICEANELLKSTSGQRFVSPSLIKVIKWTDKSGRMGVSKTPALSVSKTK